MLIKILIALALIVAVLVVVIYTRPAHFSVTRSITIAAAPDVIFPNVNEMRKWEPWNPFAKFDPNAKMTYEGPPAGVGASYAWDGNSQIGAGKNTIVESKPSELVRFKLEFFRPMAGVNDAVFTFKPEGTGTVVTWTMTGEMNFMAKAFSLVMDCDKMCGGEFEKGLASMKAIVEGETKK